MIILRFFKEQNWKYAVLCLFLLLLFYYCFYYVFSVYSCASITYGVFLLAYSLKFYRKKNRTAIDEVRLFLFFSFLIFLLNANWFWPEHEYAYWCLFYSIPIVILISYFYSLLFLYNSENHKINMKKLSVYLIFTQTIVIVLLAVNCLLLKTETEKQIALAKEQIDKATEERRRLHEIEVLAEKAHLASIEKAREAARYKDLYEEALKQKK